MGVVSLAATVAGEGPPVVLLHAFPLDSRMFDDVRPMLSQRWRLITPDLRGFGRSALGSDAASLDRMADDVAALMQASGLQHALVGGISMGGYVAMAMLRRHPQRVAGLLLMDTKGGSDPDPARENRERMAAAVVAEGPSALHPMLESLLGEQTRAGRGDIVARVRAWIDQVDPEAAAWAQRAMAARPSSFADLRVAHVPGAVIVGEQDTVSSHEDALALARELGPGAVVHVIPGSGHLTPVERPQATAAAMLDALRHLGGPEPSDTP